MPHRIFLVEDHPVMREAYTRLLKREDDIELCATAGSGEEALDMLDGMACDLIIADVSLPGMDGIELITRLLAQRPDLVALVTSAYEEEVYIRRAREAGARAFLNKKDLATTLPDAIRSALAPAA